MNTCEVCFKPCNGRRCKKHPEYHPEAFHLKALKEDLAYRLECRLIDMEGQITPSIAQNEPDNLNVIDWIKQPVRPTEFQQIRGELNYLMNRLNEHLDKSEKGRVKHYKYD